MLPIKREALTLLETVSEGYLNEGHFGTYRRECVRAVIDFWVLHANNAIPVPEIVERSIGIYEANYGQSEERGVNKENMMEMLDELLNGAHPIHSPLHATLPRLLRTNGDMYELNIPLRRS